MKVEIITVSDSQLTNELPDVEAKHAARCVREHGLQLTNVVTASEDEAAVTHLLYGSMERADVVIMIGELAPKKGILLPVVSAVTGYRLIEKIPGINGAIVLGMPGVEEKYGLMFRGLPSLLFLLPKNRKELGYLFDTELLPYLEQSPVAKMAARWGVLRMAGVSRSIIEDRLKDFTVNARKRIQISSYAERTEIRVWVEAETASEAGLELERLMHSIRQQLGHHIYGNGYDRLETVLYEQLARHRLTLVLAEINTGAAITREWRELATTQGPIMFAKAEEIEHAFKVLQEENSLLTASCRRLADELRSRYEANLCLLVYCKVNRGGIQVFVSLANETSFSEDQGSYGGHPTYIAEAAATRGLATLRRWLLANQFE